MFEGAVPSTASMITLTGPAFDVSIERLRDRLNESFTISHVYLYNDSVVDCVTFQNQVQDILAKWYYTEHDINSMVAVITPGCIESAQINQLAASWNVLFISTSNSDPALHDKRKSPSWITTNLYPSSYYGDIFCQLAEFHNWTGIEILLDENSAGFYVLAATLTRATMTNHRVETVYTTYSSAPRLQRMINFREFLQQFSTRNRILLFLGGPTQLRLLLVFIGSLPFPWQGFGNFSWHRNTDDDNIIREAYKSLLLVTMIDLAVNLPPTLPAMLARWIDCFRRVPFYRNLDLSIEPTLPQLTSTTAALEILGEILSETLLSEPAFNYRNGTAMANKFINRTFSTTVGNMSFDRNGERGPLLVTTAYVDPSTGGFKVYLCSQINEGNFRWALVRNVEWHNGSRLPPSQPVCGYAGDAPTCQTYDSSNEGFLGFIVIVMAVISGVIFAFKRSRLLLKNPERSPPESDSLAVLSRQATLVNYLPRVVSFRRRSASYMATIPKTEGSRQEFSPANAKTASCCTMDRATFL
ncbi:hypothetical protein BV898_09487 [Hypsibius exemplaris]|uniref:Receptor ligand binding region domain-containing protein n=1 Tax=Hypsibius exemplaris TaxID=2072580 RepID=A0A1W0WME1_HYPEX|nr:hypothetical protein BV898_09487 [Hypsibius exemplaris]